MASLQVCCLPGLFFAVYSFATTSPQPTLAPLDEISYNSALHAMTKESDPKWVHRAEDMFDEMKQTVTISQITYHVLMNIYGKCAGEEGARKAEELLRSMEKDGFSASDISYNICIDAYARRGNYQKAEGLLEEMISLSQRGRTECRPSIHSFASVVSCCSCLRGKSTALSNVCHS